MAKLKKDQVLIKNVEAIHELVIDIPDDSGGVLKFVGRNTAGKTTALRVVQALLKGKGRFNVRDEEDKGVAEGFGRKISVGQSTRHTGQTNVPSLEGDFDFDDFVNPRAKDAEVRDDIRQKALLTISGTKPDPSLFYDVCGGRERYEQFVPPSAAKNCDLVELASRVRRALHEAAGKKEAEAEHAEGNAESCLKSIPDGVELCDVDIDSLHRVSNSAASELALLKSSKEDAERDRAELKIATNDYERKAAEYDGPSVEDAAESLSAKEQQCKDASTVVENLKLQLANAQQALHRANVDAEIASKVLTAARQHMESMRSTGSFIAQLKASLANEPDDQKIMEAEKRVEDARNALNEGILMKDWQKSRRLADAFTEKAQEVRAEAEDLRSRARSVDSCLAKALPPGPLRVKKGRLVLDTERGQGVLFDECSDGEKWRVALPYGIASVGTGGHLVVSQDAWQHLDDDGKAFVARQCFDAKVWLYAAEVGKGPLRAEIVQPE